MKNPIRGLFRSRDKPQNLGGGYSFFFGGTTSGKAVNEHTAMQMTAVYSCVRILAETVAGLPLSDIGDGVPKRPNARSTQRWMACQSAG